MRFIDPSSDATPLRAGQRAFGTRDRAIIAILAVALIVFTFGLGRSHFVTSHEGRVAQTARIMADAGWPWNARPTHVSGFVESSESTRLAPTSLPGGRDTVNPWLFPVINDAIRLQKPPLPYWATAVLFKLFGVSEFTARLAGALLGVIATWFVWDLTRFALGRRAAIVAAIAWISMRFVADEMRRAMADPYLAFFALASVWAFVRAKPQAAWVFLGLGALAKGPVILVHVIPAIVCARMFLNVRPFARPLAHVIGVALFLAIVLPWPLMILRASPELWRIWVYEAGGNVEKARPWWLYLATSSQLALPWTPVWLAGLLLAPMRARHRFSARRNRRRLFAVAWYLIVLMFFSCLSVKKDAYMLPAMPAQAMIIADAFVTLRAAWLRRRANYQLGVVLACAQCAIGIGFAAGLLISMWRRDVGASGLIVCGLALLVAIFAIPPIAQRQPSRWLNTQFAAYALILVAMLGFYEPANDNLRSSKQFAAAMTEYLTTNDTPVFVTRLPEEASFYLPLDMRSDPNASRVLVLIDKSRRDPPVDAARLSDVLHDAPVHAFQRVLLNADDGSDRYQLFDVVVDRSRA